MAAKHIFVKFFSNIDIQITAYPDHSQIHTFSVNSLETLFWAASLTDDWTYCQPLQPILPLYQTVYRDPHKEFFHNIFAESHLDVESSNSSLQPPK